MKFIYIPLKNEDVSDELHRSEFGAGNYVVLDTYEGVRNKLTHICSKFCRLASYSLSYLGFDTLPRLSPDHTFPNRWLRQLRPILLDSDYVVCEYIFMSKALLAAPLGAVRVVDTHDAFSDRHLKFRSEGARVGYWLTVSPHDEAKALSRADVVIAIQASEAQHFSDILDAANSGTKVTTVGHLLSNTSRASCTAGSSAVFVASNSPANRMALKWLIDNVIPLIREVVPEFVLQLVGSICDALDDNTTPGVRRLGFVPTLDWAFNTSMVAVNPVQVGTGMNIKLLDAISYGIPVVSTETGIRGIDQEFLRGVITCKDQDHAHFADAVVQIMTQPAVRSALADNAYMDANRWRSTQLNNLLSIFR